MRKVAEIVTFSIGLVLALALATPAAAAGPELIARPFDVKVANGVVTMNFALTLSEAATYPVTITASCCTTEEVLYEGTLAEGVYRLSAPLKKISGHGEVKVVLKTQVTTRTGKGTETATVSLKWQGPM